MAADRPPWSSKRRTAPSSSTVPSTATSPIENAPSPTISASSRTRSEHRKKSFMAQTGSEFSCGLFRRLAVVDAFRGGGADVAIGTGAAMFAGSGLDTCSGDGAGRAHCRLFRRLGEFGELITVEGAHSGRIVKGKQGGELAQIDVLGAEEASSALLKE